MPDHLPLPAQVARTGRRRWLALAALVAVLAVGAAGLFAYSRLTAGMGHRPGDTITHAMPGGGSVSFTLESVEVSTPANAALSDPSTTYMVRIRVQNLTGSDLNMNAVQFQVLLDHPLPPPAGPAFYPQPDSRSNCDHDVMPGASTTCAMMFALPAQQSTPKVAWLPDGAGNTSAVWWYLVV